MMTCLKTIYQLLFWIMKKPPLEHHFVETAQDPAPNTIPISFHSTFYHVYEKLKKWIERFPFSVDNSIFNDLTLLYLLATKKYLDHRGAPHLFKLLLSLHFMQKKLLHLTTFTSHLRHLEIRWMPTNLLFPFSTKPVLGCVIGFNVMGRYEVFDEENVVLALQKHLPELRLVKGSSHSHTTQHQNLKMFYFEIEKKDGTIFSLQEQQLLKTVLEEKVRKGIQPLSPTIFMQLNDEEIYKSTLVLSQEIQSLQDLPQAYITLDQQTGKEIVFRVNLVHVFSHQFPLKDHFFDAKFVSERIITVKHLENHPIKAHIFCLHLARIPSLLRSDGSLDFYSARQKVVALITDAVGEFRDYNGGIIIKQQEQLQAFKEQFPEITDRDPELLELFFYNLMPLEKQITLPIEILSQLFRYFLEKQKEKLTKHTTYTVTVNRSGDQIYLTVHAEDSSFTKTVENILQNLQTSELDLIYNFINPSKGTFFNCVFTEKKDNTSKTLVNTLQDILHQWDLEIKNKQTLRIGLEYSVVSLDPRIGGEAVSGEILRLLFEGLTRFNQEGKVENAIAESITISSDLKTYTFKIRPCFWSDGFSPISAYDFEYAWKKILSPDFATSFAQFFYSIKNAKEAKEGKVSPKEIGIHSIDAHTLKVELNYSSSNFLLLTSHHISSPVNHLIDQKHPQWPYECEKHYPCSGPFQLKLNQPNQGYQLVKNPFYWDAQQISLEQITLTHMSPTQAIQSFHNNEIDWVGNPFGGWHSFNTPEKEDRVVTIPNTWVCWCAFNTISPPFHNQKLRQAFAYAIKREEIIENDFIPLTAAYTPLLPQQHQNSNSLFPKNDPEQARKLFEEALDELGIDKKNFEPIVIMFHEKGIREYTAQCLKKQLEDCLGIDCHLKALPWNSVFHRMTRGNFQMGLVHWRSWFDDPSYTLNNFKNPEEINFTKWQNSEFQSLLSASEQESNSDLRSSYFIRAEEILRQEMPIIPLFYQPQKALIKKDIHVTYNYQEPYRSFNITKITKRV